MAACVLGQAQDLEGYVVRVESSTVYLDFGEESGAFPSQPLEIYALGEELLHPITKKSLGRMEEWVARGTIKEVRSQYSAGEISQASAAVKAGMRVRLKGKASPEKIAARNQPAPSPAGRQPRWKAEPFPYQAAGMAVADFRGDGRLGLVLAQNRSVALYDYPPKDAKPLALWEHPGLNPRILSLEAADLNGNGRAELFATLYNETFSRVETVVLELEAGQWKKTAELAWAVRRYQNEKGRTALAMQKLLSDRTFPFSSLYPLSYKDGRYIPSEEPLRPRRVEWLYSFTLASLGGGTASVFVTPNHRIRVQFEKGYWKSDESYGQTPLRVRWMDRLLEFNPPMPVKAGGQTLYLVRNTSMLGSLSEPFGLFNNGEIHRKSWDGLSLVTDWTSELGGYSPAITLVDGPDGGQELAVLVVSRAGQSSLWIYDP